MQLHEAVMGEQQCQSPSGTGLGKGQLKLHADRRQRFSMIGEIVRYDPVILRNLQVGHPIWLILTTHTIRVGLEVESSGNNGIMSRAGRPLRRSENQWRGG